MYSLVSIEKVTAFFLKFGIDVSLFTSFELSVLIILSNIFMVLFYFFVLFVAYKIILKLLDWWF